MEPNEDVRKERIAAFQEIVGQDLDDETCAAILASNDWNVESTARNFYDGPSSPRTEPQAGPVNIGEFARNLMEEIESVDDDDTSPFLDEPGGIRARRGRGLSPDRDSSPLANGNGNGTNRSRTYTLPPAAPKSVMALVKEAITGQAQGESSSSAARRFAADFDKIVGPDANIPEFFESSFEDALLSASTERKMLAVYLHAPLHPDTEAFCKDILCSRQVLNALADARMWGGSVHHAEGYLASTKVQAAGYPCLVLITTDRDRDAKIVDRLYVDDINEVGLADRIAARINAARNFRPAAATPTPQLSPAEQRAMDERRRMVEEQDAALRQAMEEDRRREQEKKEREKLEEEEQRRKETDERRKKDELERKRQRIRPEPEQKSGTASIRFQFPGGTKLLRRFEGEDKVGYVREVLDVYIADQLKTPDLRYALVLNYPKKTLTDDEANLKDSGLVPQAVLFLQDLDA